MKLSLSEVKQELSSYLYLEHTEVIDVMFATILANRLAFDDKIWLAIVGESSGGKSQIIKPVAISDPEYFISVDDLTDNAFLSGAPGKEDHSLLNASKTNNMMIFSDLTVLFSKSDDSQDSILSQLRMIFDGELTKPTGSKGTLTWRGRMGILAGCTPSIYRAFERVSDMGDRFMMYRLPENNKRKAVEIALTRKLSGWALNDKLADIFTSYLKPAIQTCANYNKLELPHEILEHIYDISEFAEQLRTPVILDYRGNIIDKPAPAYPTRTAIQLAGIARALLMLNIYEGKEVVKIKPVLDRLAWSLSNDTSRAVLEMFAAIEPNEVLTRQQVGDYIGLPTAAAGMFVDRLVARGILVRTSEGGLEYKLKEANHRFILKRMVGDKTIIIPKVRATYESDM